MELKKLNQQRLAKQDFEYIKENFEYICYIDGSCYPNPSGPIGVGIIVQKTDSNERIFNYSEKVNENSNNTNNVAEYLALYKLMIYLIENKLNNKKIIVYGDSMLVMEQISLNWKIKSGAYSEIALKCKNMLPFFSYIYFGWIKRELNKECDYLSKKKIIASIE